MGKLGEGANTTNKGSSTLQSHLSRLRPSSELQDIEYFFFLWSVTLQDGPHERFIGDASSLAGGSQC